MSYKGKDYLEFSNKCLLCVSLLFKDIPILKRAYPVLLKLWAYLTWTGGYKIRNYKGSLFFLNFRNHVDRCIGLRGGFEHKQTDYLFSNGEKNGCDMFLDIGANIGLYTLNAAQTGFIKEIHSFEPDPRNYAQLQGNLYLNKLTDMVKVYKLGVSDKVGSLKFEMFPETSTGRTRVLDDNESEAVSGEIRELSITTLDTLFDFKDRKILIKMDVEGHEKEAIKGGENLLRNNKCFMQVESWPGNVESLKEMLVPLGYSLVNRIDEDYYFTNFEVESVK